jgi:hypothetical protein
MPKKWIGFGEEDSDQVMAQEGQFVDFWDDYGGLVPPPSGVHWWMLQPAFVLLVVDLRPIGEWVCGGCGDKVQIG